METGRKKGETKEDALAQNVRAYWRQYMFGAKGECGYSFLGSDVFLIWETGLGFGWVVTKSNGKRKKETVICINMFAGKLDEFAVRLVSRARI